MSANKASATERFEALLGEALEGTALAVEEVLELAEERCAFSYIELAEALHADEVRLEEVLESCLGRKVESVCLLPAPNYIEESVDLFRNAFAEVSLCDNKKTGRVLSGLAVLSQDQLDEQSFEYDAYLNTTSSSEVEALFAGSIPAGRGIDFASFATEVMRSAGLRSTETRPESVLERIRRAERPLVVLAGIYLGTYTPTLAALAEEGFQVFVIARSETAWLHAGHLCRLGETLAFADVQSVDYEGLIWLLDQLDHGTLFMPGAEESFIGCAFDCRRAAAANAFVAALLSLSRIPTLLGMYDVVKPVMKRLEFEADSIHTYRAMFSAADAVTIGANTREAGEQAVQALGLSTPVSSFYRYGVFVEHLQPKNTDGIHIAIVGGALISDSDNPFLPDDDHFRALLDQGLHLHVYSSAATPVRFQNTLNPEQSAHFHIHGSISDPQLLTKELSQYQAGMILNDTAALIDMVAGFESRFLRELAYHFLTTMVPSASMLFGCAGLPIILNRTTSKLLLEFGEQHFIPTELSELPALGERLRGLDWKEIHRVTKSERREFSIRTNLPKLVEVIETLEGQATSLAAAGQT